MIANLFPKQDVRALMVGLDDSGRTTALYWLKLREVVRPRNFQELAYASFFKETRDEALRLLRLASHSTPGSSRKVSADDCHTDCNASAATTGGGEARGQTAFSGGGEKDACSLGKRKERA